MNMGWYWRGRTEQEFETPESLAHKIIYSMLVTFTLTGFLLFLAWSVRLVRLLLSLFVLPGKPVSACLTS